MICKTKKTEALIESSINDAKKKLMKSLIPQIFNNQGINKLQRPLLGHRKSLILWCIPDYNGHAAILRAIFVYFRLDFEEIDIKDSKINFRFQSDDENTILNTDKSGRIEHIFGTMNIFIYLYQIFYENRNDEEFFYTLSILSACMDFSSNYKKLLNDDKNDDFSILTHFLIELKNEYCEKKGEYFVGNHLSAVDIIVTVTLYCFYNYEKRKSNMPLFKFDDDLENYVQKMSILEQLEPYFAYNYYKEPYLY